MENRTVSNGVRRRTQPNNQVTGQQNALRRGERTAQQSKAQNQAVNRNASVMKDNASARSGNNAGANQNMPRRSSSGASHAQDTQVHSARGQNAQNLNVHGQNTRGQNVPNATRHIHNGQTKNNPAANGKELVRKNDREIEEAALAEAKLRQLELLEKREKEEKKRKLAALMEPYTRDTVRVKGGFDRPMLIIVLILIGFGLIMVFSSSYAYALSKTGDSFYYIKRQITFAAVGIVALIAATNVDYLLIKRFTVVVFFVTVGFLIVTPIYGLAAGAATRWIDIGGFRFQPSEVMKLALVLMLARYFQKYEVFAQNYDDFWQSSTYGLFLPITIVGFVCILIALENHFSCMIIMFLIGMIVIFSAGVRKFWFVIFGAGGAVAAFVAIMFSGYARERVDVWLHPENYAADDEVYQTLQGLYAIGSGGFLGVGLGNSRQKHLFVSQPQNDFIFSIVCEELGFIGAMAVIVLFVLLVWRGVVIAMKAPDTFSQLVVIGIVGKVAIQALLNIGVVTALLPNTGISLPFFSYGGTALMMQIGEMGIVLGISRYSRKNS